MKIILVFLFIATANSAPFQTGPLYFENKLDNIDEEFSVVEDALNQPNLNNDYNNALRLNKFFDNFEETQQQQLALLARKIELEKRKPAILPFCRTKICIRRKRVNGLNSKRNYLES